MWGGHSCPPPLILIFDEAEGTADDEELDAEEDDHEEQVAQADAEDANA